MYILLQALKSLVLLWHLFAFSVGAVYVWQSYRALLGPSDAEKFWSRIIRQADIHLWLSGFAVIAIGMALTPIGDYFADPKLWAKGIVVTTWLVSSQFLRRYALPRMQQGDRTAMLHACAVNLACWLYGAFLGVAKGLAAHAVPLSVFAGGFAAMILLCIGVTMVAASP